jgi:hypothetical protein
MGPPSWKAPRFNLWHIVLGVAVTALLLGVASSSPHDDQVFVLLLSVLVLAFFFYVWKREFLFLMQLEDDELPGRFDKLIWFVMLTAFAPVGVWFFRSYRVAHWPEPKAEALLGETAPEAL